MSNLSEIFIIYVTFFTSLILFSSLRSVKGKVRFEIVAILLLGLFSGFAVYKTSGQSFYVLPLLLCLAYFWNNRTTIALNKPDATVLLVGNLFWLLFFAVYYIFGEFNFRVPHEDYIIYSRVAYYNSLLGIENTKSAYNLLESNLSNDVYHFTEIWGMAFLQWVNGQSLLKNYFFCLSPLVTTLIFLGMKELIEDLDGDSTWLPFLGTIVALVAVVPFDALDELGFGSLPMVGVGSALFQPKYLFTVPVIIGALIVLQRGFSNTSKDVVLVFYYPPMLPVVLPSLIASVALSKKKWLRSAIWPVIFCLYFVGYAAYVGSNGANVNVWYFTNSAIVYKALVVGFVLPVIFLAVPVIVLLRGNLIDWASIKFVTLTLVAGVIFWIVLADNWDSNQMFRNTFFAAFTVLVGLSMMYLVHIKKWRLLVVIAILYVAPFSLFWSKQQYLVQPKDKVAKHIESLPSGKAFFVVPAADYIKGILEFNERIFNPLNEVFMAKEDLHLINTSSSFPIEGKLNGISAVNTVLRYRAESPIFQACGEWNGDFGCLMDFGERHSIDYVFAPADSNPEWKYKAKTEIYDYLLFDKADIQLLTSEL